MLYEWVAMAPTFGRVVVVTVARWDLVFRLFLGENRPQMAWARAPWRAHTRPGTTMSHTHDLTNHIHPLTYSNVHIPLP